jgi:hypothetical protein
MRSRLQPLSIDLPKSKGRVIETKKGREEKRLVDAMLLAVPR